MKIYINTNKFQKIAALVSKYSFERYDIKSVELLELENNSTLFNNINNKYKRDKKTKKFLYDLQSFTLLRLFGPQKSNYSSHILSIDPDIFAIKDPTNELKKIEKQNEYISCPFYNDKIRTEVIAYNCDQIEWSYEELIEDLFNLKKDYKDLINLNFINREIKKIDNKLNELDTIKDDTILLHTTNRITQPWKIDLKVDFQRYYSKKYLFKENLKKIFFSNYDKFALSNKYLMHEQELVFETICKLFKDAYKSNYITKKMIIESIENKFISKNFCEICELI